MAAAAFGHASWCAPAPCCSCPPFRALPPRPLRADRRLCALCRLRREQRLATASPDDVPKGASAATTRHLNDRFEYYLRNQDDEGSYGLHNFH